MLYFGEQVVEPPLDLRDLPGFAAQFCPLKIGDEVERERHLFASPLAPQSGSRHHRPPVPMR